MAKQTINNAESGLTVRGKLNDNFTELYDDVAALLTGNIEQITVSANTELGVTDHLGKLIYIDGGDTYTLDATYSAGRSFVAKNVQGTSLTIGATSIAAGEVIALLDTGTTWVRVNNAPGASGEGEETFPVADTISDRYYTFDDNGVENIAVGLVANQRFFFLKKNPREITIDEALIRIMTLQSGASLKLAFHEAIPHATLGYAPGDILGAESAVVDCSSLGTKQPAISATLPEGWIFVEIVYDNAGISYQSLTGGSIKNNAWAMGCGTADGIFAGNTSMGGTVLQLAHATFSDPLGDVTGQTFTETNNNGTLMPIIGVKAA